MAVTFLASASAKILFFFSVSERLRSSVIKWSIFASARLRSVISTIEMSTLDRSLSWPGAAVQEMLILIFLPANCLVHCFLIKPRHVHC